ncbi:MAG: glutamate--tRNA ligase [Alphaproteobacteria bacterium]
MSHSSEVKVRFAPSPTGKLHLGNAYIASLNWLFAKSKGGTFLLRMDDTDSERSQAHLAEQIRVDLRWLGLDWDEYAVQSERLDRYSAAKESLISAGRLYPCFETPEELDLKRKVQQMQGKPPVYDREAISQTEDQRAAFLAQGRSPHWRFKLDQDAEVEWDDVVRGSQTIRAETQSDPILIRGDGRFLYTLSSCVDDLELGVTHILRGGDHVSNTVAQVQLFEALKGLGFGGVVPKFGHLPLVYDKDGSKLSKRLDALSLERLRGSAKVEPQAIVAYMASLGTPEMREPEYDIKSLANGFDLDAFNAGAPRMDEGEIEILTAKLVRTLPYDMVKDRTRVDQRTWDLVAPNLSSVAEAESWLEILDGNIEPIIEDKEYISLALECFPSGDVDEATWAKWTGSLRDRSGRKGKALFMPLRLALTGQTHGPDMARIIARMGRERALMRLAG